MRNLIIATLIFSIFGIFDAGYLTFEHFSQYQAPCSTNVWVDCGKVLNSTYSEMWGIPVAVLGLLYYIFMTKLSLIRLANQKIRKWAFGWVIFSDRLPKRWQNQDDFFLELQLLASTAGITFSLYFVYLQLVVIQSICFYCMLSAISSSVLFGLMVYQRFFVKK